MQNQPAKDFGKWGIKKHVRRRDSAKLHTATITHNSQQPRKPKP